MMKYKISKVVGTDTVRIQVVNKNHKEETMLIELSFSTYDPKDKTSMAYSWWKKGYKNYLMSSVIHCMTYVTDSEGGCYGAYNPQMVGNYKTNFDWILEDTPENRVLIIRECLNRFENATGESATEKKMKQIQEYAKEEQLEIVKGLPEGWRIWRRAIDVNGVVTINNNCSPFKVIDGRMKENPEYQMKLLLI